VITPTLLEEVPSKTRPFVVEIVAIEIDWLAVMVVALPARMSGEEMVRLPASTVMAWAVVPLMVRLPPEMPTGAVVLIVSEEMVWSPPRFVVEELEEMLEKLM